MTRARASSRPKSASGPPIRDENANGAQPRERRHDPDYEHPGRQRQGTELLWKHGGVGLLGVEAAVRVAKVERALVAMMG